MRRIAVLISNQGSGSNLQALIDGQAEAYNGQVVCVVSDKASGYGLIRAREADIPTESLDLADYERQGRPRAHYEKDLAYLLQRYSPDLIVLAGWTLELSETFLRYFEWRVINLHSGLLPAPGRHKYKLPDGTFADPCLGLSGANAIQAVLASGQTYAGSTVHAVTPEDWYGPILARGVVKVEPEDTILKLHERITGEEHRTLLRVLRELCVEESGMKTAPKAAPAERPDSRTVNGGRA
jgi:phosphoribosylglycinamide formyltransferase-1